jgi:hypothetical protein
MNETIFSKLHYQSGLVAQGCWDELDEYDREAIIRFGDLIVKECITNLELNGYDDAANQIKHHFEKPHETGTDNPIDFPIDNTDRTTTHEEQQEWLRTVRKTEY